MISIPHYYKQLIAFKPRDVPLRVALRNTLGIILPLAIGVALGRPEIGLGVATGALNTMFADQPGPYRLRMVRMLLVAVMASLSAFAGYLFADNFTGLLLASLVWGFGGGLLVSLGPHATRVGVTSMILLVVTAGSTGGEVLPLPQAIGASALIFAGGLLQMVFAIAAWPLQRYRPERLALSNICRQLAWYARQNVSTNLAPPLTQAMLDLQDLLYRGNSAHNRSIEVFRIMAEVLERIRIELLALTDLHQSLTDSHDKAQVRRVLNIAARILMRTGRAMHRDIEPVKAQAALQFCELAAKELAVAAGAAVDYADHRRLVIAHDRAVSLNGQLRALVRYAAYAGGYGELRMAEIEARLPEALRPGNPLAILRANLNLSSVACRHALRCAATLAVAVACERIAGLGHSYWIPMTAVIVLKPDFSSTVSFSLWRMAGTLAGLVLITTLVHVAFSDEWSRIALLAVLSFAYRILMTQHYGVGVALLTGAMVVLFSFYGITPGEVFSSRAAYTVFGSLLGLGAYLLWPTWERTMVRPALAKLLDAYRAYVMSLFNGDRSSWQRMRTGARSARSNAQASLDRLRSEPQRDKRLTGQAEGIFANANRLVRAAMSLEAALQSHEALPEFGRVQEFAAKVDKTMMALAYGIESGTPARIDDLRAAERELEQVFDAIPDYAEDELVFTLLDTCDRLTDCLNTISHLLRQSAEIRGEKEAAKALQEKQG